MADNIKVKVLDIDSSKSQQSIAGLKKEIKDLKDKLVGLKEGTEEYNNVLAQCAEKTHQLKEVQEQVAKSSTDFGDRMSNVRGVMGGMAGAVGAVTGALSMMGVAADKDSKLLKIMVSAMSITSGIQSIDQGVKAFKALAVSIKAATAAQKALNVAMSASVWGIALAAIGLMINDLMKLADVNRKAKEAAKEAAEATAKAWQDRITNLDLAGMLSNEIDRAQQYLNDFINAVADTFGSVGGMTREELDAQAKLWEKELENLKKRQNELLVKEEETPGWKFTEEGIAAWEKYYDNVKDVASKLGAAYNGMNNEAYQAMKTFYGEASAASVKFDKDIEENAKKASTAAQQAVQERLKIFKDGYNLVNTEAKIAFNKHETTEEEYYQTLYENLITYNNKVKKATQLTTAEIAAMQLSEQEAAMKVSEARIKQLEKDLERIAEMSAKPMLSRSTVGDSNAEAGANVEATKMNEDFITEYLGGSLLQRLRMQEEYQDNVEKMEYEHTMARLGRERDALFEELDILEGNYQNELNILQTAFNNAGTLLDAKHEEGLISDEEYNQQRLDLENEFNMNKLEADAAYAEEKAAIEADITANERVQSDMRVKAAKKETEDKLEQFKKYSSAASSALSYGSQLISALQDNIDTTTEEGFEQNKKLEMANATISFLQGLISLWSNVWSLGPIAGPIVGAAMSTLLTGIYATNISKIQSTTMDSGGGASGGSASVNPVTVQSIEHPISNVRQTTTASDYEEIGEHQGDTRVYVLASDIEEVTGKRKTQVSNATY